MDSELTFLLQYKNPKVVTHFCHHHPELSLQEGEQLFTDLLAWMWLNRQRVKEGKKTYLFGPLLLIDEIWHTFILHSRDYFDFCQQYFDDYFHHEVEPIGFEYVVEEVELIEFVEDCIKYLDSGWVERRFAEALVDVES